MRKLAIVSGGTRGIGRAIVEKFSAMGFNVAVSARDEQNLILLKKEIEEKHGVQCFIKTTDMSKKTEVENFAKYVISLKQQVAVLVNNAGIYLQGDVLTEPDGTLETLIETNLYSAYYLTKNIAPLMIAQRNGHIFNICSIASIMAYKNSGAYTISKFAQLGFSKSLREELKPDGVRVTAVMPGATLTDSWAGVPVSPERLMPASDIAEMIWATFNLSKNSVVEEIIIRPQLGDL